MHLISLSVIRGYGQNIIRGGLKIMDDERMDEKKTFDNIGIDHEIEDDEPDEPLPEFDEEMGYSSFGKQKKERGFSKVFKMSNLSTVFLVILLILLIGLFIFISNISKRSDNNEIASLSKRLQSVEEQVSKLNEVNQNKENKSGGIDTQEVNDRFNKLESLLNLKSDQLEKEIQDLKKGSQKIQSIPVPEKPKEKVIAATPKAKEPTKKTKVSKATNEKFHIVKKGENLFRIAQKYNLKEAELLKLNGLKKGDVIIPGQKLKLSK
jgi:LysM repeat protein